MHSPSRASRMLRLVAWSGLAALAVVLASCGQPQKVKSDVAPAQGTLEIAVQGVAQAPVQVFSATNVSQPVYSESVAGKVDVSLGAGTYFIDGGPVPSTQDPSPSDVVVKSGQTTRVLLVYQNVPPPSATAASLSIEKVTDDTGAALPNEQEQNINKTVFIYASQTEEAMCVTVQAKDASGAAAAGVPIVVNVSDTTWLTTDRIAILNGCATQGSVGTESLMPASFRDGIYTGSDGTATFTLYATAGITGSGDTTPSGVHGLSDLAKVVVAAENADSTTVLAEFKAVFYNIAHLYASLEGAAPVPTGQRVGKQFSLTNLWNEHDLTANGLEIATVLFQKQPQQQIAIDSLGKMKYEIVSETDKSGSSADVVHFDPAGCAEASGSVCTSTSGDVQIVPNDGLHLEDMPIHATVDATLLLEYVYGSSTYWFPLKSYSVEKQWIGSYMRITKSVDHHVLTWAGDHDPTTGMPNDEKTLDAANAPTVAPNSVFTATFTLTATNEGTESVYDVSIADLLPAELGILESTIQPAGGTYDSVKHAVTWNYQQAASDSKFLKLDPGQSITVSFQVYVRQKPGYCVDPADLASSGAYASPWMFKKTTQNRIPCYDDPYEIINGAGLHDVTASWFSSAPSDQGGIQAVTDFNGFVNAPAVKIWAVRPEFSITKTLYNVGDAPFQVGTDAQFDITLENVNVTGLDREDQLGSEIVDYSPLMTEYPNEFNGTVRDNPYGANLWVGDIFSKNLDFNDATPLTLHDDDGVVADQSFAPNFPVNLGFWSDKGILWTMIPLMGGGDVATARVTLDHDGASHNLNIAGMTADNLNQLDLGCLTRAKDDVTLDQIDGQPSVINLILDCADTWSETPTSPWLELDSVGTGFTLPLGSVTITHHSSVVRGDDFNYMFMVHNSGDAAALSTTNTITIDNTTAAHITGGTAYVYDEHGVYVGTEAPASFDSGSITWGPHDFDAGYTVYFQVNAHAYEVAHVTATSTVDYDADSTDSQYSLLPETMSEVVAIQPPF